MITLVVLTLNEIDGIRAIMPQIKKDWIDQVIVVDGGSSDGTIEYAKSMGYDVICQKKPGLVNAYREAFPFIKGDIFVTFSPDGNSIPEAIPILTRKITENACDMVIASRYLDGAHSDDDSRLSGFGNWLFTRLINAVFGASYSDSLVIFRAYRKSVVPRMGLLDYRRFSIERLVAKHHSWDVLSSLRAPKLQLKVEEISAGEPKRIGGIKKTKHIRAGLVLFALIVQEWLFWKVTPNAEILQQQNISDDFKATSSRKTDQIQV